MDTIVKKACGLDVHQKLIVACIMRQSIKKQIKKFGTTTKELNVLKKWLQEHGITHVAMESTGVYWKPVFNILGDDFELLLVNARHIKNVPGRKTDVQDCEWICKLLRAGLLNKSFVPKEDIRKLRDLTRYQKKLQHQIQNEKNRVHKLLQDTNIKITSVLSDIFGKTGRKILNMLANGVTEPERLAEAFNKYVPNKKENGLEALEGKCTLHHKVLLKSMLFHIDFLEQQITCLEQEVKKLILPYQNEYKLLQSIPGVKEKAANTIIAEISTDMEAFASEKHLVSWAGLCPGQNESAGKKKRTRLTHGNNYLKSMLVECAWCAIRQKDTYLRAKYYSLVPRMGKKKALVSVAHKLLIACYFILKYKVGYKDLGPQYLNQNKKEELLKYYVKKLGKLGYQTELKQTEDNESAA